MKRLFFLLSLALVFSCDCEDLQPTLPDELPSPFQVFIEGSEFSLDGEFVGISYLFNKSIDSESVVLNESLLIDGISGVEFQVINDFTPSIVIFGFIDDCDPYGSMCTGSFTITFKGTGDATIRTIEGQILDGDYDNVDGGDFVDEVVF